MVNSAFCVLRVGILLVGALSILPTSATAESAAGASSPAGSDWLTPVVEAPRVTHHTFDSGVAATRVSYHLYRPAAYEAEPDRRFPVVYWLHGSGGGLRGIAPLARQVDRAIQAGQAPPFMVVFVNGLRLGMYVDWKDGSVPMETLIVRELVPHIDARYRTIATRNGRMLDGFSMGVMAQHVSVSSFRTSLPRSRSSVPGRCSRR